MNVRFKVYALQFVLEMGMKSVGMQLYNFCILNENQLQAF